MIVTKVTVIVPIAATVCVLKHLNTNNFLGMCNCA